MKASKLFVTFYDQIGRAYLKNRPTFIADLFKSGGCTHEIASRKSVYAESDYRYPLCNGKKPLSLEIKRSFPDDVVDVDGVAAFFEEHINRNSDRHCRELMRSFEIDASLGQDAGCLSMALALQFKAVIDEKEYDEAEDVVAAEYNRLLAEKDGLIGTEGNGDTENAPTKFMSAPEYNENDDYFNLFVVGMYDPDNQYFKNGRVVIPPDRALCEYITDEVKARFEILDEGTLSQIKMMPSIFACENNLYDYPGQKAYLGSITDIKRRENGFNIYFRLVTALSQQSLNDIANTIAIHKFEFTRTHWTIKNINLIEELKEVGLIGCALSNNNDKIEEALCYDN